MLCIGYCCLFLCKQKMAYELRISDRSSYVCASYLRPLDRIVPLGHRVIAAVTQWMTAADPLAGEPAAVDDAMAIDRLGRVLRATRVKAAALTQPARKRIG